MWKPEFPIPSCSSVLCVNCIDSVCVESVLVAYRDVCIFFNFKILALTLWPGVLFFHFLSFVVELKGGVCSRTFLPETHV